MQIPTKTPELEKKIKIIQDYLGPRINYSTETWPKNQVDCWLLEYLLELKHIYYKRLKRKKNLV